MRYPGILALAAFLAACTPAGMAPPTGPIPVTPEAAASPPAATAVAPAASTAPAPAGAVAADEQMVEISGEVMAPAGVHAPGVAPATGLHLLAKGETTVAKAPVRVLDQITGQELGRTMTDEQGKYKLQLGVKIAKGGKLLKVSVDLVGPNGKPIQLYSLTRIDKGDKVKYEGTSVSAATYALAKQLERLDPAKLESQFVLSDFVAAVSRIDAALRSEDLESLDLGDADALSAILKDIAEGDTTLADLVKGLEEGDDEGEESDDEDTGSSSSGGGGSSNNDDDDETEEEDDATDVDDDDEATDSDDAPTPILSGTIK